MQPYLFPGMNFVLKPAPGDEATVGSLGTFFDGTSHLSCWEPTLEEIAKIVETRKVWVAQRTGMNAPPALAVYGASPMRHFDYDTRQELPYEADGSLFVEDARRFATLHHAGQMYGENDLTHMYHVGEVVKNGLRYGFPWHLIVACYLHDTIEDCWTDQPLEYRQAMVRNRYGEFIYGLTWAVTGVMIIDGVKQVRKDRNIQQYAKIALNPMAAPVKYADRLANKRACLDFRNFGMTRMYRKEDDDFEKYVGDLLPAEYVAMREEMKALNIELDAMLETEGKAQ